MAQDKQNFDNCKFSRIKLTTLHCYETEDNIGRDDADLDVRVDGVLIHSPTKKMNNGDSWSLNIELAFSLNVQLDLWDKDDKGLFNDKDDHLGRLFISHHNLAGCGSFTNDGANYKICWDQLQSKQLCQAESVHRKITELQETRDAVTESSTYAEAEAVVGAAPEQSKEIFSAIGDIAIQQPDGTTLRTVAAISWGNSKVVIERLADSRVALPGPAPEKLAIAVGGISAFANIYHTQKIEVCEAVVGTAAALARYEKQHKVVQETSKVTKEWVDSAIQVVRSVDDEMSKLLKFQKLFSRHGVTKVFGDQFDIKTVDCVAVLKESDMHSEYDHAYN